MRADVHSADPGPLHRGEMLDVACWRPEVRAQQTRWLLAPLWQWRARRLVAAHGASMSESTAWCLVALARDPVEYMPLVRHVVLQRSLGASIAPGAVLDSWRDLESCEQARRIAWLDRYGATPLHRLGVPEEVIELAGLHVVEWRLPPGRDAASIVAQKRPRSPGDVS